ncbi:ATP-binding cassette domain-containing protein [Candidatus Poribacteria bacterium]|nr:ATP-binding cassette domain-containing protein [Candidatus Poribacteria bacterium]
MIETIEIQKVYPSGTEEIHVLRGINLKIEAGEIIAVVGASGVGKSTLLNLLGTIDRPTNGKILYDDKDVFELSNNELASFRNREIGFIFQFHHLLPEFSAVENVMMPLLIGNKDRKEAYDSALSLLKNVGLEGREEHKPGKLSGGEQQRVAVARALANNPKVILADEPTGNLDRKTSEEVHDLLWELNQKLNQTFIIATHNQNLAQRSDRIIKLADGYMTEVTVDYKNDISQQQQ